MTRLCGLRWGVGALLIGALFLWSTVERVQGNDGDEVFMVPGMSLTVICMAQDGQLAITGQTETAVRYACSEGSLWQEHPPVGFIRVQPGGRVHVECSGDRLLTIEGDPARGDGYWAVVDCDNTGERKRVFGQRTRNWVACHADDHELTLDVVGANESVLAYCTAPVRSGVLNPFPRPAWNQYVLMRPGDVFSGECSHSALAVRRWTYRMVEVICALPFTQYLPVYGR